MNKRTIRGILLIAAGAIMLLFAAGLHRMNEHQDELAGENAGILLEQLQFNDQFGLVFNEPTISATPPEPVQEPESADTSESSPAPADIPDTMPTKTVSGYAMVGILRIPSVGLELPILDNWDYSLLKISPCRYSGTVMGNDLILMGHNYRSHFKPLYQVKVGDAVEFEDVNGICYSHTVAQIETLKGSEGEKLPSEHALSVFTCNPGGQTRLVLRCERVATTEPPAQ